MKIQSENNRAGLKNFLWYFLCMLLFSSCIKAESVQELQSQNSFCLHDHYQRVCDRIITIWSVLDIMRSITIEPKDRVDFIQQLFGDVIKAVQEVVALEVGCRMYTDYGQKYNDEFHYFFAMVDHVENAYEVVFTPLSSNEEKLLSMLILELFEIVKTMKRMFL